MTSRKRQRRQELTAEEYSAGVARTEERDAMAGVQDNDLFVVDRGGSKSAKKKLNTEETLSRKGVSVSKTERTLVRKVVQRVKSPPVKEQSANLGDLWDTDNAITTKKKSAAKRSTLVVRPGQSYNPAVGDHQDILAEALALEIQKKEKDARAAGKDQLLALPAAPAMDGLTRFSDSDSDDSNSGAEEQSGGDQVGSRRTRRNGSKLTRAQRNKIRFRKAKSYQELKQKQELRILKEIDNSAKILDSLEQKELRSLRKKELEELKKAETALDSSRLTYEEAGAVPLTDELKGSLRQITAKGMLVGDKVHEMRDKGQLMKRDKKRKHFEAPHGAEKIVWIPKYKY